MIQRRTSDPTLAEVAQHGANAADRGATLVSQLLSFAREQALEPTTVNLGTMFEECGVLVRQSAGASVRVDISIPDDLPAVRIDPVRLETTLINLTVNARDAMAGTGTLTISARTSAPGEGDHPPELNGVDAIVLTVSDTGCGMDAETIRRATEPFFTTKAPGKGTGLASRWCTVSSASPAERCGSTAGRAGGRRSGSICQRKSGPPSASGAARAGRGAGRASRAGPARLMMMRPSVPSRRRS